MKFHTFSHYIFAPGFMFTLHLLYLFAHHHKVHKANLWLSNLPSHAPRNLSNPSCSAPACACWPVLSNMPAAGCWGGICMVHWKENYPELKWLKVQSSYHETTKPWLICPALHRPLPVVVLLHPSACLGLVPGGQSKVCPKWFASTQWVPASCWFSSARRPASMGHVRMRLRGMHAWQQPAGTGTG